MGPLTKLFIEATVKANEATNDVDRSQHQGERRGIRLAIEALYGAGAAGEAVMAADRHYLDQGYHGPMTGGLWLDWKAEPEQVPCRSCVNGRWEAECCNGSGGCSCRGERVDMGTCHVCHGTGFHAPDANTRANADFIRRSGACFLGSGPSTGYWAGR